MSGLSKVVALAVGIMRFAGIEFRTRLIYIDGATTYTLSIFDAVPLSIAERKIPYGGGGTDTPVGIVEVQGLSYAEPTSHLRC